MGFRDKIQQYYINSYMKKYGDRLTQVQGKVLSCKIEKKSIIGIFHKLKVTLVVKNDHSRSIANCVYTKNKWFKKPTFIHISQGNSILVQGLKGKKDNSKKKSISSEILEIINVRNFTTKEDLSPIDGGPTSPQTVQPKYRNK